MATIATLHHLMIHQLRDIYSAEKQLVQALPKMVKQATSEELQAALSTHLNETQEHVARLEQAFEALGVSSRGMKCKGMEGLIEEGKELFEEDVDPEVLDAGIIAASQRIEHYEIAAYGTVCEYARSMGHDEVVELLEATLAEEKEADTILTSLAEGGINALASRGDEMEAPEGEDDEDAMTNGEDASVTGRGSSPARKSAAKTTRPSRTGQQSKGSARRT